MRFLLVLLTCLLIATTALAQDDSAVRSVAGERGAAALADVSDHAADRVALVIGNGNYSHTVALTNPANDAADVTAVLESLGFQVVRGIDLTRSGMEASIREFAAASSEATTVLFFYAGHGMQVNGRNYLIPTDAKLEDSTALDFETIDVEQVFRYMSGSGKVALAFLDACRNNPLSRSFAQKLGPVRSASVGRGLAVTSTSDSGLFIAYATAPNDVAQDGSGRNSPFTAALLRHLPQPDVEIQQVMTRVKADVRQTTNGRQRPWHNSDLSTEVYLGRGATGASAPQLASAALVSGDGADALFWRAVENSADQASLRLFLDRFPDSPFAREAGEKLAALVRPLPPQGGAPTEVAECKLLSAALNDKLVEGAPEKVTPSQIIEVCERAAHAAQNDIGTYVSLGMAYENIDRYAEAETQFLRASQLGSPLAKYMLGARYQNDRSDFGYDPRRGEKLLTEAYENAADDEDLKYWTASLLRYHFEEQKESEASKRQAQSWYDRYVDLVEEGVRANNPDAIYRLAIAHQWGEGNRIPRDIQRATELFQQAALRGHAHSSLALHWIYVENDPMASAEGHRAEKLLRALYNRGSMLAGRLLASLYEQGPLKDIDEALAIYYQIADWGVAEALLGISHILEDERSPHYDPEAAQYWDVRYAAAKKDCGINPHEVVQKIRPEFEIISTPANAARCYLSALRKRVRHFNKFTFVEDHRRIDRRVKQAIQTALRHEGFYRGAIDGDFGSGTMAALIAYKDAH